jgi:ATP-dependent exoDNAse (exonuclease V) beta subunit
LSHISFSELKIWNSCPYKHKLQYIDKNKVFTSTEYTCFGIAIHETCEKSLLKVIKEEQHSEYFEAKFKEELKILDGKTQNNQDLIDDMVEQGKAILSELYRSLDSYLEGYEVVATEQPLFERIQNLDFEYDFKGFIDLVLKTPDGKYHIIDWKTCSWGWGTDKRSDPMINYQLTYYKKFYAQKFNIDPKMIETHFALLKRTAKKDRVEFFRVTSGTKKTENANTLLTRATTAIKNNKYIKNRCLVVDASFIKPIYVSEY